MVKFSALLLDIEGTITSISFVKDTLFPYAYNAVESFIREHFEDELMTEIIADIRDVSERESKSTISFWCFSDVRSRTFVVLIINECMFSIYPDVLSVLQSLSVPVYIYSSGSVLAQKLLFGNSVVGDVTKNLSGYFDTNVGLKGESESYEKICKEIGVNPSDVLFLTDVEAEARAARAAGVQVILVVRDGNSPLSEEAKQDFRVIHSLEEIC
ncbi:unnamed protein product [Angiostrongylus costaricensis]|uniref:2,3-diketo-5-methylthio-1-phosphopentane phosphatase n=1 Tax=Angiostrongylus costaricensis TaxID=334426 RepID=A0A0R3PUG1_ANGCS|nr:unnamed protein product [Angiostrongylus costaricensis]